MQSFSAAAERLFGYGAAEVLGKNVKMLMPVALPRRTTTAICDRYMRHRRAADHRHRPGRGRASARTARPFRWSSRSARCMCGNRRFFTGFIRDLTERQQTEARLQELQSELVHMSRLTAMGEMASALAHELNQPLSAIANYMKGSRRLLRRQFRRARRPCCATPWTRRPIRRCAPARSSAACAISSPAARASGGWKTSRSWSRRRARWRWSAPRTRACACASSSTRGTDFVLADKVQIQQVLLNLMRNAIEAMEERRQARTRRLDRAGAGRHGRDQRRRYRRRDLRPKSARSCSSRSSPRNATGMGVGLSISRTIIEAHGGSIAPRPNPGGGTVFRFTLPAVTKEEAGDGV